MMSPTARITSGAEPKSSFLTGMKFKFLSKLNFFTVGPRSRPACAVTTCRGYQAAHEARRHSRRSPVHLNSGVAAVQPARLAERGDRAGCRLGLKSDNKRLYINSRVVGGEGAMAWVEGSPEEITAKLALLSDKLGHRLLEIRERAIASVSYTHLTLPTILLL